MSLLHQLSVVEVTVATSGKVVSEERAIRGDDGQTTRGVDLPGRPVLQGFEDYVCCAAFHFLSS